MKKKMLAMLLAAVLAVGLLPGMAWATNTDFLIENGTLMLYSGSDRDVTIPNNVIYIYGAFWGQGNLTSVTIPDSVIDIGDYSFRSCTSLDNVVIPGSVTSFGKYAFQDCTSLSNVTFRNGITTIGVGTFYECTNLTNVVIPESITTIKTNAFYGCDSLTDVYYGGSASQWNQISIEEKGNEPLANAEIHYNSAGPETTEPKTSFSDVPAGQYYTDPVAWAVEKKITTGTGDGTTFSPKAPCTRAEIVTFLWRAYGEPEPATTTNPFTDVKPTDYYYKAVLWAVEKGVTSGTGDGTTFTPKTPCTRAEAVTFQFRAAGSPLVHASASFTDVPEGEYYTEAVAFAVENKITTGTGDGTTFTPKTPCTRAEIVTFLWRQLGPNGR